MRTFAIADIHARGDLLEALLKKAPIDPNKDRLIILGDICDIGDNLEKTIQILNTFKHRIFILGNHDKWELNRTYKEYAFVENKKGGHFIKLKWEFLTKYVPFFIDEKNRLFVHGGFKPGTHPKDSELEFLIWDRDLISYAAENEIKDFDEVFVGHTATQNILGVDTPIRFHNLWMLDTGCGYRGKLTIMDVDTKDYWQLGDKDIEKTIPTFKSLV